MASKVQDIVNIVRTRLIAATTTSNPSLTTTPDTFFQDSELGGIVVLGAKDLWRAIVDLKAEYFAVLNTADVSQQPSATTLQGVPQDLYKVINIEPTDVSANSPTQGLIYQPRDYNHRFFRSARAQDPIDAEDTMIYYDMSGVAGSTTNPVTIRVAPPVNAVINIALYYVPMLPQLGLNDFVPIPGDADNALVAWGMAFARSKEREDRSPDPAWLEVYATEKQNLLESLGLRQYQEPLLTDAVMEEYWG